MLMRFLLLVVGALHAPLWGVIVRCAAAVGAPLAVHRLSQKGRLRLLVRSRCPIFLYLKFELVEVCRLGKAQPPEQLVLLTVVV
jgi:hypothetical protein